MKKVVFLLLASFLALSACGQEESKLEDKKETKSSSKESKKDENKKSNDDKKETSNADNNQQEETQQANTQQQTQSTQEQPQTVQEQSPMQQEPTAQEKAEANAKIAKEHGYTGLPNGDAHSDVPVGQIELTPEELAKEEAKPEYQDVVESEEESDWVKGQDEWMNASESERTEIRKADAEKYGYEYDPTDYE